MRQTIPELKKTLDRLYLEVNRPDFIPFDPVQFPRRYQSIGDKEVAAFLSATIAWGRRDMILKSAEKMFSLLGKSPHEFIMEGKYKKFAENSRGFNIHRTFFESDLRYFCKGLKTCYAKFGSLENLFASAADVWEGISLFRETMAEANSLAANSLAGNKALYSKHISNPAADSACKRLHLALRWLVRREGPVDLGLWKSISPSSLFIPLDLHVGRTARQLGLLQRRANDKKAVISLTEKLRAFCPEDPVKYDFALFGYSVKQKDKF
jgi:uncharacterized protein (TIGR02757 family)